MPRQLQRLYLGETQPARHAAATYRPQQDARVVPLMCCDVVSRGLAHGFGKIYLQQADATLVALDARSGRELWVSPPLPSGVVGNVVTWLQDGRQYVGVLTGIGGLASDPDGLGKLRGKPPPATSPGVFAAFALPEGPER